MLAPQFQPTNARPFKVPSAHQRLWKAARVLKTFDAIVLSSAAAVAETTAREFLGLLSRANYVVVTTRANGKTGVINRYRLATNTGPRAPRRVFDYLEDGNSGAFVPLKPAQNNRRSALCRSKRAAT
jgi:hypothetical protein